MLEELRRMALITSGVAELTKNRAEQVVKDLVKAGDIRKDQTSGLVKELLRRSQENRKELTRFVRSEITHQIESLGLASGKDLERLERRITRLESTAPKVTKAASVSGSAKKVTAKKTTAKKTAAKKPSAKKATPKKTSKGAGETRSTRSAVSASNEPQTKGPVSSNADGQGTNGQNPGTKN